MAPRRKVDAGYEAATTENLPKVNGEMLIEFLLNFSTVEDRGTKAKRSMRTSYNGQAVGFVQLKRTGSRCQVVALVTPEHKVSAAPYKVSIDIDEMMHTVESCKCHDCAASEGGCKHGLALLSFLVDESSRPSVTSTDCYWKASTLSLALKGQHVEAIEFNKRNERVGRHDEDVLEQYLRSGMGGTLSYYKEPARFSQPLSLHWLACTFCGSTTDITSDSFIRFLQSSITPGQCYSAERVSRLQSKSHEWKELRYGRITASIAHRVSRCAVKDGTLSETIMGAYSIPETAAIARGRALEKEVLQKHCPGYKKSGLIVDPEYPVFGASPDGLGKDSVYEVKCPSKPETVKNYLKSSSQLSATAYSQVQLQIFLAKKTKGLFIVADPNFEENGEVTKVEVLLDRDYVAALMDDCLNFWKKFIFPKLMNIDEAMHRA